MPSVSIWLHDDDLAALDHLAKSRGLTRSRAIRVSVAIASNVGVTDARIKRYAKERRGGPRDRQVIPPESPEVVKDGG